MINIKKLSYKKIIKNISLHFETGKINSIIGKNGSGKSTLLKCISGIINDWEGEIFLKNKKIKSFSTKELARELTYIPQKTNINYDISVRDFLFFSRYAYGDRVNKAQKYIQYSLETVGMQDFINSNCRLLSGGEFQKIMLAGALVQESPLWILDEPTAFLDPGAEHEFFILLNKLSSLKKTIIIVTHHITQVLNSAHYITSLKDGEILYAGSKKEFTEKEKLNKIFDINFHIEKKQDNYICYPERII
ncbi:MAG: ABC transporter ATP-binding protein [Candidatus Muiribacteriota bacterium]